jgi:hypothetical protein
MMPITPPEPPAETLAAQYQHGPLESQRIPRGEVDQTLLKSLEANGQLRQVPEDWREKGIQLPPRVTWVVYPNGDLERVGFD